MLGDVPRHHGESSRFSEIVVQTVVGSLHEDAGSVFSNKPSFAGVAARLHRPFQPPSHLSCGVDREEDGEMLAHHLAGAEAGDSLGANVPTRNAALGIEHDERVVSDPVDEEAESLFALAASRFGLQALGDVTKMDEE